MHPLIVPSPRERVDLHSFKLKMKMILKENESIYWESLKKFAQSKLTKNELDEVVKTVLVTEENISLHNLFIQSIIHNTMCPPIQQNPPIFQSVSEHKRKSLSSSTNSKDQSKKTKKKKKKKAKTDKHPSQPATPVMGPGSPISAPQMQNPPQQRGPVAPSPLLLRNQVLQTPINLGTPVAMSQTQPTNFITPLTINSGGSSITDSQGTSNLNIQKIEQARHLSTLAVAALRSRMHKIAFDNGLSHVSPEAVLFMMNAVEIMKHTKCGNRGKPSLPSIHPPDLLLKHEDGTTIVNTTSPRQRHSSISMEDLHDNILANPSIFGQDYAITMERIGLSLLD